MFDDFDFDDTHDSEPNDYNPYESEADGYSPYDTNADSDASYLDDASEESQDGILGDAGDSPFFPAFGAASSEELDSTDAEETASASSSNDGAKAVRFGSIYGCPCDICGCDQFLFDVSGDLCKNCGHHRKFH